MTIPGERSNKQLDASHWTWIQVHFENVNERIDLDEYMIAGLQRMPSLPSVHGAAGN